MSLPMMPEEQNPVNSLTAMTRAMQQAAAIMQKALATVAQAEAKVDERLHGFEDHLQADVVVPIQQRMGEIERKQRDSILVTPAEQQELREAVAQKAREFGSDHIHFSRMYGRLHREFGIPKYGYLRQVDFQQALKYVANYDGKRTTWPVK